MNEPCCDADNVLGKFGQIEGRVDHQSGLDYCLQPPNSLTSLGKLIDRRFAIAHNAPQ
jgi:hypothetical protein